MKSFKSYIKEQILQEANYEEMFSFVKNEPQIYSWVKEQIQWAKKVLKKQDRITWFLRFVQLRAKYENYLIQNHNNKKEAQNLIDKDVDAYMKKVGDTSNPVSITQLIYHEGDDLIEDLKTKLEHFIEQNIPDIDRVVFKYQNPTQMVNVELRNLEQRYTEKFKDLIPQDDAEEQEQSDLIGFPNGWKWVNLEKSYCDKEGKAMGHCGNVTGKTRTSDRILSLREPVKVGNKTFWRPHLTFILEGDGRLGEMKGKGNQKPSEKYHSYIVALLKSKFVKGIRTNAGYLPEHDFKLSDLPEEQVEELLKDKPELGGLAVLVDVYGYNNPTVKEKTKEILNQHMTKIDVDGEEHYEAENFRSLSSLLYSLDGDTDKLRELQQRIDEDDLGDLEELVYNMLDDYMPNDLEAALSKHFSLKEKDFDTREEFLEAIRDKILEDEELKTDIQNIYKTGNYGEYINKLKTSFMDRVVNQMNMSGYMPSVVDDYADPYYPNYALAYEKNGKVKFVQDGNEAEAYDADHFYKVYTLGSPRDDVEMALMLDDGNYERLESDWYDDTEKNEDIPEFDQSALQKQFNNTIRQYLGMGGFDNEKQLKLFQSFKEYFNRETDTVVAKDSGYTFRTGKEITIPFIRNTEKAPKMGKRFQQDIEPNGTYMLLNSDPDREPASGWIKGTVTFESPLVIPLNLEPGGPIYNESSWKYLLAKKYKKTGKALTQALKNDGYDAIVTVDLKDGSTSEIVKL